MFALRPYQEKILDIVPQELKEKERIIVQLPTGMGKTVVFSKLISMLKKPTLVIAHREELLTQAWEKIINIGNFQTWEVDIVLRSTPDPDAKVWVASIQTLIRGNRLHLIKPELIIIDECHHSIAKSYRKVLDYFPSVPVVGFTATPTRSSKKEKNELVEIWDDIVYQYPIKKAILDGYLAGIEYYQVKTDVDLGGIKTVAGDFAQGELGNKVNVHFRNQACVDKYLSLGGGKCVVFCVDVSHSRDMCQIFREGGIKADVVTGDLDRDERRAILAGFAQSPPDDNYVLCNCMVLTEGWDCPDVKMLILARPTQSIIVYLQQLGRGLRVTDTKKTVIVVDIADNCKSRKICNCLSTVFDLHPEVVITGNVIEQIERMRSPGISKDGPLELVDILFNMPVELESSKLAWYSPEENRYYVSVDKGKYLLIEDDALKYSLYGVNSKGKKLMGSNTDVSVLDQMAYEIASKWWNDNRYMWDKSKRLDWGNSPPTERQVAFLRKATPNIDPSKISKATAAEIISAVIVKRDCEPATKRQICFLRCNGVNVESITKREASRIIARIKNGQ